MRPMRALISLALVGLAAGCGGGGDGGPTSGVLNLTLNTPNSGDGAILFHLSGGAVDSVGPTPMVASGSYNSVGNTTRIVVAGPITDGVVVQVFVPDIGRASSYVATIEQVAVNATFAQRSLAGYTMGVTVAP